MVFPFLFISPVFYGIIAIRDASCCSLKVVLPMVRPCWQEICWQVMFPPDARLEHTIDTLDVPIWLADTRFCNVLIALATVEKFSFIVILDAFIASVPRICVTVIISILYLNPVYL